ncbi:hypothetical protein ACVINY_004089 [Sinorhizobium meliloti]
MAKLRIIEENVDVETLTVIDLEHQGCTAPKSPTVDHSKFGVCLFDDAASLFKQVAPSADRVFDQLRRPRQREGIASKCRELPRQIGGGHGINVHFVQERDLKTFVDLGKEGKC